MHGVKNFYGKYTTVSIIATIVTNTMSDELLLNGLLPLFNGNSNKHNYNIILATTILT